MDSRDASVDETRPLNPDGEHQSPGQQSPRPLSPSVIHSPLTPPVFEEPVDETKREISIKFISVVQFLTVDVTLANIIVQIIAAPRSPLQQFLVVWDFAIIIWYSLALLTKLKSKLPSISVFIGDWSFQYTGLDRRNDYGDAVREIMTRRQRVNMLLNLIDTILTFVLLGCSIASVSKMPHGWYKWYYGYRNTSNGVAIAVLHFFAFAFMFINLLLRFIQARIGTSVSLKFVIARDNERYNYRIHLPNDKLAQKGKPVPIYA